MKKNSSSVSWTKIEGEGRRRGSKLKCLHVCVSECVCAVSSCGMLSRQEELSGTSGTNQRRRAQGHEGSERRLKKGKLELSLIHI